MKTSLTRRLESIEQHLVRSAPQRHPVDLFRLSNAELEWLEGIAERRDAWTGTEADWIATDLTSEERLELTRIAESLA